MKIFRLRKLIWCFALAATTSSSVAQAQLMINVSLVTCAQYLAMPPDQSRVFSAWMSGWFNQKTGYAWINLNAYARNIENVKAFCASNPGELVMTSLERSTAK
jgi:hypothetical protein